MIGSYYGLNAIFYKLSIMKYLITGFLCVFFLYAVCEVDYRRLHVGDKVPDVEFSSVRNYNGVNKKLSDFRGKYIILDFWDRTCTSCIEGMPKMERLQEQFNEDLQILLVTRNNENGLANLFQNSAIVKNVKLPMVLNDSVLTRQLFPYQYLPRHIWIDKNGIVIAITQASEATASNISKMIAGEPLQLTKREDIVDEKELEEMFSEQSSLLSASNSKYLPFLCYYYSGDYIPNDSNLKASGGSRSYSLLMKRIDGAKEYDVMFLIDGIGKETGMRLINTNLKNLYRFAYGYGGDQRYRIPGKLIIEPGVFEEEPADPSAYNKWADEMSFCYETRFPEFSSYKVPDRIRSDLEAYFGVTAIKEERPLTCYVFYRDTCSGSLNYANENEPSYYVDRGNEEGMLYSNMQFLDIFNQIMYSHASDKAPPIINETGLTSEKLTMTLHINKFKDMAQLQQELRQYGLGIREEKRKIQVLVLKKIKP